MHRLSRFRYGFSTTTSQQPSPTTLSKTLYPLQPPTTPSSTTPSSSFSILSLSISPLIPSTLSHPLSPIPPTIPSPTISSPACLFPPSPLLLSPHRAFTTSPSPSSLLSGGLSARSVASEAARMKSAHTASPSPALAQQARRLLLSAALDVGPQIEGREVSAILSAATYFGLGNDCGVVRQAVVWCKKFEREIMPESMGPVVMACAALGDTVSMEVVSMLSIRAMRMSRYLDSKAVTHLIAAFAEAGVFQDKLALYMTRRFVTLGKIGEFNAKQLVVIIGGLAKSRYHNIHIRNVISRRISYLREQFKVTELVPLVVGIARLRIKEEKIIKKLAAKSVEIADHMTSTHVCTLFQAFAYFGVKYDQLFGVLTNRAVELMDEFTAKHVSLTLASFQKISISNPELFDNLAERAMSVMQDHDAADVTHILNSLVHFSITDEELLRRLAEQSISTIDCFNPLQLTSSLYALAKLNYRHDEYLRVFGIKILNFCSMMNSDQLRRILWAFAKLEFKDNQKLIRILLNKAYALHFEFFQKSENAEEVEEIFDAFGRESCPELYDMYISRGTGSEETHKPSQ